MIKQTYTFEIISPCFCGGANPKQTAEIRASSIRGQLRWWFRVLGGFKSLEPMPLPKQEELIFGSAAGDKGLASQLIVRIFAQNYRSLKKDGQGLGYKNFSDRAYLTFPFQSREKHGRKTSDESRGVIKEGSFGLSVLWKGDKNLARDIHSLCCIFGHLGALGARSRRAMGALFLSERKQIPLSEALGYFIAPGNLTIKALSAYSYSSSADTISQLGNWLKSCRAHGRSEDIQEKPTSPYFDYAKNDHDLGYGINNQEASYRPALGLPIVQKTKNGTNNWEWNYKKGKALGRFASPVILRPHKAIDGSWHALVIFVESQSWPENKKVYLNGKAKAVSRQLYEDMKNDDHLSAFV